jgi:16S rRNA (cytosine967-C5)-methyltransferase
MTKQTQTAKGRSAINSLVSPARLAAFKILQRVEADGAFASLLLAVQAADLSQADRALVHELVMGVLRNQRWLDCLIQHYGQRDPQRLDLPVRLALRLGLYQLRFLSRVPASAAVNESVKLVRLARLRSAEPFANAVLRRATREAEYDPASEVADPVERLAIETSHPSWLIERWVRNLGFEEARAFARANLEVPPTAFRIVNPDKNEVGVLEALRASGATVSPSAIAPSGWRVTGAAGLLQELSLRGQIYLQDEASQLVAHVIDARAGERVLDVCAAPGSKTTHIADLTRGESVLIAGDLHWHRLRAVVSATAAQHLANLRCVALDALRALPFPDALFDRVLVDAPCTGTGTLRRNPEIRGRISAGDIDDLADRQIRILLNAARMLKRGGQLVYSTCSIEPEENELVIDQFMKESTGFQPLALSVAASLITNSGAARIWPQRDGADGFFIAAFTRND